MKNYYISLFLLILLTAGISQTIIHQEIRNAYAGDTVLIEATIIDIEPSSFSQFALRYRPEGQNIYQELPLQRIQDTFYSGELSLSESDASVYEYYLQLILNDGAIVTFPDSDAAAEPLRIEMTSTTTEPVPQ